ncbi:hypothetical protein B0H66DRAFT_226318 [Apodospora peruviana]|uniref:Ribosomal protein S21 n=1 Tax=Apodospora peruviana TaxID=516989 RepID=A0AAE0I4A6_9PEZI|nr:hypothetical protein B0H66DRAFT_226318 [Apodospora peruviana]
MEFRQAIHSVCRSTRPSLLLSARQPASSQAVYLLQQIPTRRYQSSSSEASPAAAEPAQEANKTAQNEFDYSLDQLNKRTAPARPSIPGLSRQPSILSTGSKSSAFPLPPRPQRAPGPFDPPSPAHTSLPPWTTPVVSKESDAMSVVELIDSEANRTIGGTKGQGGADALWHWEEQAVREKYGLNRVDTLRLRPSIGRTIPVKGKDEARKAFFMLQRLTKNNNLNRDFQSQRFHERPALRRKRQLRERWRHRFRSGFKAVVHRAMELRGQGW